ncbi:FecR family protein [Methylococcaceae bacterium WWC4]|nr:FecR family protein [Methylococcaceae bacterium WWC4]
MQDAPDPDTQALVDDAIDWLVLLRSGNVSAQSRAALETWLQADTAHRQAFAEAEALWGVAAIAVQQSDNVEVGRQRRSGRRLPTATPGAWAAAAVVLLGVALAWSPVTDWATSDYRTGVGEQRQIALSDGSRVLLNTDTAIALEWSAARRGVVLRHGQAEFQVAKDSARPFVVMAGDTAVTALGTVFAVYADSAGGVDVSVSEHAVKVELADRADQAGVRIDTGQRLSYRTGAAPAVQSASAELNAWTRGKLIFDDRPLAEVVAELNRYSRAKIVIGAADLKQRRLSGVFPLDAEQVLEAIQALLKIRTTRLGPWLVVLHG